MLIPMRESFEDFKNSFSYGSRSDLSFKFLKALSDDQAAEFLARLLHEVGEMYDGAGPEALLDLAFEWQVKAYTPKPGAERPYVYEEGPFEPLTHQLEETTVGLVTSSGHFDPSDPPGDGRAGTAQESIIDRIDEFLRNAPELSTVDLSIDPPHLEVVHPGYDTRSASRDPEVTFPARALQRAANRGGIGSLASTGYSFVGACSQGRLRKELDHWIDVWKGAGIEALFLVPV